jgi:hypothetical protein
MPKSTFPTFASRVWLPPLIRSSEALSTVLRFSMIEIRNQFDLFQRKEPQFAVQPRLSI